MIELNQLIERNKISQQKHVVQEVENSQNTLSKQLAVGFTIPKGM